MREARRQLTNHLQFLEPGEVDLILLPEATLPLPLADPRTDSIRSSLAAWADTLGAPLVFGSLDYGGEGPETVSNSVFVMAPDGLAQEKYDKVVLVPMMELGIYGEGEGPKPLSWGELTLGPLICYESLFGGLARRQRLAGARVLLNLTSDVWFGDGRSWIRGFFLQQHPAHLVLRAVENRMPVARSANGGYSLFLDPVGRTVLPPVSPAGGLSLVALPEFAGTTLYTRIGDWVGPASALVLLLLLLWDRRSRRGPHAPFSG
jgi:apolipoprotein N-acyltransferase